MSDSPQKILVAQTLFLGDVILTIPLIRKLRSLYPQAQIDVLVREEAGPVLRREPTVSATLVYDKLLRHRGIRGLFSLAGELRSHGYNIALVLPGSVRTVLAVYLARIPRRIGTSQSTGIDLHLHLVKFPKAAWYIPGGMTLRFATALYRLLGGKDSFLAPLFTDVVILNSSTPALERNLQLLKPLGAFPEEPTGYAPLSLREEDFNVCNQLFPVGETDKMRTVAVAPGSFWKTKRWPAERFIAVIQTLLGKGIEVVLLGGGQDKESCDMIASRVNNARLTNLCGKLNILESAAVLTKCRVLLSNDSAAMHISAAMGTPVIVILGPTVREFGFIPPEPLAAVLEVRDLWCRPCTPFGGADCPTGTLECMERLSVAAVLDAVDKRLKVGTSR